MYQTCNQLNASGKHILKSTHKGHRHLTHVCTGNYEFPIGSYHVLDPKNRSLIELHGVKASPSTVPRGFRHRVGRMLVEVFYF